MTGDFNGDGRLDLATDGSVLLGNGDGTFQPAGPVRGIGWGPTRFVAGDFNGDGRLDLAVTDADGGVSVLLGNGDGTFQAPVTFAAGFDPGAHGGWGFQRRRPARPRVGL